MRIDAVDNAPAGGRRLRAQVRGHDNKSGAPVLRAKRVVASHPFKAMKRIGRVWDRSGSFGATFGAGSRLSQGFARSGSQ